MNLTISVIIPVEPGGSVEKVLNSLPLVDYPEDLIEIFVVEGKNPSRQRNEGLKKAKGEIVCFLDGDSVVSKDLFREIVSCYTDYKVAAVGGPNLTLETDTLLQKCFGYILGSSLAVSRISNRYKSVGSIREVSEDELILCNLSCRRSVLEKEGGFNELLYPNEENEMMNRLRSRGYKLIHNPRAIVYRSRRKNIFRYAKQLFNYGRGRMEQTFLDKSFLNPLKFLPIFFILYLLSLMFFHAWFYLMPFLIYLIMTLIFTGSVVYRENKKTTAFLLTWLFPLTHICYGSGLIWGVVKRMVGSRKERDMEVKVSQPRRFKMKGIKQKMKLRVAIVYPPIVRKGQYPLLSQNRQFRFSHSAEVKIYPLIPASAATLLNDHGFPVLFLDGINERLSKEDFNDELDAFSPDVIVLEAKAPIIKEYWNFINEIKRKMKEVKTVLVGDHVSLFPRESFKNSVVDYCLTGGDYDCSLLQLVKYLSGMCHLPKGVYYRDKGQVKNSGKFALIKDMDILPLIDRDLTRWRTYGEAYLYHPCAYILSGRGCGGGIHGPGRCKFCIWQHALWNCTRRLRSPGRVVEEIKMLVEKYGVREIFDDNESGAIWNRDWLEMFYREMSMKNLVGKVAISSNARADSLDRETCQLLKKIGFRLLKVGLESGNDDTLERLDKQEKLAQIRKGVKIAKDYGLKVLLTTMVGYPWEGDREAAETYRTARELMLYKTHFGDSLQSSVIVPYPGTPLHAEASREDWFISDPDDYTKYDMSVPILKSEGEPARWCRKMWKVHYEPGFLLKSLLSINNIDDLKLAVRGIRSLIGHVKDYR